MPFTAASFSASLLPRVINAKYTAIAMDAG
jgi:hypothetical protein